MNQDLEAMVELAILTAKESNEFNYEPINWGDLHCIEIKDGFVLIEEAAPTAERFRSFVENFLFEHGYPDLTVKTEW